MKSIADQREFLERVIKQTILLESGLQIAIVQPEPQAILLGQKLTLGKRPHDLFTINVEVKVKRCGREVRLVVPCGSCKDTKKISPGNPHVCGACFGVPS